MGRTAPVENRGRFKPGSKPWNAGKTGVQIPWNKGTKGLVKSNSGTISREKILGELNPKWKGDEVGYGALHGWVQRTLGKASKCEQCSSLQNVQWSNVSWEYLRDPEDWQQLCRRCHMLYDRPNWGEATRRFGL